MPILGASTTQGGDTFPASADRALVTQVVLSEAGDFTEVAQWFATETTAGTNAKFIIYADSGGEPGAFIFMSPGAAIPAGGGLVTWAVSFSLAAGTYWIGYVTDGYSARHNQTSGVGQTRMMNNTFNYDSAPATWDTAGDNPYTNRLSAYATYTVASSGVTATLSVTTAAATLSAAGTLQINATAAVTTAAATLAAAGTLQINATVAVTTQDAVPTASGTLPISAAFSAQCDDAVLAAAASVAVQGTLAVITDDAVLSTATTLQINASVSVFTDPATLSASASSDDTEHGSLNTQLQDVHLDAFGTLYINADVSVLTENAALSAAGSFGLVAETGVFLQDATLSASATLQINANVSVSLENVSLLASGNNFTDGEAAFSLFVPAEVTKLVVGSEITRLIIN
jgi:hypothetical protein